MANIDNTREGEASITGSDIGETGETDISRVAIVAVSIGGRRAAFSSRRPVMTDTLDLEISEIETTLVTADGRCPYTVHSCITASFSRDMTRHE